MTILILSRYHVAISGNAEILPTQASWNLTFWLSMHGGEWMTVRVRSMRHTSILPVRLKQRMWN